MSADRPWQPAFFLSDSGECPVCDYIRSETDTKVQAKIVRKIEHLAAVGRGSHDRTLWDTVDGAIKRLRVDDQVRILFSWEEKVGWILLLAGTRTKNGRLDPKVVADAKRRHEEWLSAKPPKARALEAFHKTLSK